MSIFQNFWQHFCLTNFFILNKAIKYDADTGSQKNLIPVL